jgi:hypothetical protein
MLAIGNYMNGTSKRGGAWGFHFTSLLKVCQTKTTNNKRLFMEVLIDILEKGGKSPSVFDHTEKFPHLVTVKKFSLKQLQVDLENIKSKFRICEIAASNKVQTNLPNDKI